jgi:putative membrane protein
MRAVRQAAVMDQREISRLYRVEIVFVNGPVCNLQSLPVNAINNDRARVNEYMIERYRDHAANERTYLAWVRTGITVMVLGFIVEKFEIFIARLQGLLTDKGHIVAIDKGPELVSMALVVLGLLVIVAGAARYFVVKSKLDSNHGLHYRGSVVAMGLTFALVAFGFYLLLYLARII